MDTQNMTSGQVSMNRNPTGKGGLAEHPENISPGGLWNPKMTFSFQYKRFLNMPVEEFKAWKDKTSDKDKTMVEELAYVAVLKARTEFKERQEITNRTEGMPRQTISVSENNDESLDDKLEEINDSINKKLVGSQRSD